MAVWEENKNLILIFFGVVVLLGLLAFVPGLRPKTNVTPAINTAKVSEPEVEIKGSVFNPIMLTVKAGEKIKVTNRDGVRHSLTSSDGKSFDTGLLAAGDAAEVVAPTKPGTYPFHCTVHASMKGNLIVE